MPIRDLPWLATTRRVAGLLGLGLTALVPPLTAVGDEPPAKKEDRPVSEAYTAELQARRRRQEQVMSVLVDAKKSTAVREAALKEALALRPPQLVDVLIPLSYPRSNPDQGFRESSVKALRHLAAFTTAGTREDVVDALRGALNDPSFEARDTAMKFLSLRGDPVATDYLTRSLKEGQGPYTPAQAVRYLTADDPKKHFNVLRPLLRSAKDQETRVEAALALGADEESRGQLKSFFTDANQPLPLREAAVEGLATYDPQFPTYAATVINNPRENPAIRASCINQLTAGSKYGRYEQHKDLIQESIMRAKQEESLSPSLREAIGRFERSDMDKG